MQSQEGLEPREAAETWGVVPAAPEDPAPPTPCPHTPALLSPVCGTLSRGPQGSQARRRKVSVRG